MTQSGFEELDGKKLFLMIKGNLEIWPQKQIPGDEPHKQSTVSKGKSKNAATPVVQGVISLQKDGQSKPPKSMTQKLEFCRCKNSFI